MNHALDVTGQWRIRHAHLQPFEHILKTGEIFMELCPRCLTQQAIAVLAHIRIESGVWLHNLKVLYCRQCERYLLPLQDTLKTPPQIVTDINARLWSHTPAVLNLEPTTRCNFHCWYCIGRFMDQGDLNIEAFIKILNHFPQLKVLVLVGEGEPFLNKSLFDMVKAAKERKLPVFLSSNGSPFTDSMIQKICVADIDYISVSIDSSDPGRFSESRIKGDLWKVWENIERLIQFRNKHGYQHPIVGLKGTLFAHTQDELPAILAQAKKKGVDVFENFQTLNPKSSYIKIYPKDKLYLLNTINHVRRRIDEARRLDELKENPLPNAYQLLDKKVIYIDNIENEHLFNIGKKHLFRKNCDEQWVSALVSGDVTPCCQIKHPFNPNWNLTERSIEDIMQCPEYENLRFNLWNGLFPMDCEGCSKIHDWN